jgi:hypothetical protein
MIAELFVIRIFAIFLIVNSHLEYFYPISVFASGGQPGNSIFYLISGYGLSLSYQCEPLPIGKWFKKRFLKFLIPLIGILIILNIGNLKGLQTDIWNQIIWHDTKQLELFLPVLLALYISFLPLFFLKRQYIEYCILIIAILAAILFVNRVNSGQSYGTNLPTEGIFFSLNALECFIFGIYFSKISLETIRKLSLTRFKLLILIVIPQIIHKVVITFYPNYVWINFYLNLICVAGIFLFLMTIKFKLSSGNLNILRGIATCSLALYLVHFKVILLAKYLEVKFPYSILFIFTHSFLWAFAISYFTELLTTKITKRALNI